MAEKRARVEGEDVPLAADLREAMLEARRRVGAAIEGLTRLLETLDRRIEALDHTHRSFKEARSAGVERGAAVASSRVRLSVRGKVFWADASSLLRVDGSFFQAMVSSEVWLPTHDGAYFIDRPYEGFERILDFLRSGVLALDGLNAHELQCVEGNLEYFRIRSQNAGWTYSSSAELCRTSYVVYSQKELAGARLCVGCDDGRVRVLDTATGQCELTLDGHGALVWSIVLLADGRVCSGSSDRTIKIWNVELGRCDRTLNGHSKGIRSLAQLSDGRLVSASDDKLLKVWNVSTGACVLTLSGHSWYVHKVIQLRDQRICSSSFGPRIMIWNSTTGACEQVLNDDSFPYSLRELGSSRLIYGCNNGVIRVADLRTGAVEQTLTGHTNLVRSLLLLESSRLCSGSRDYTMRIWNLNAGTCEVVLSGHTEGVYSVVRLSDNRLCSSSSDRTLKIWS